MKRDKNTKYKVTASGSINSVSSASSTNCTSSVDANTAVLVDLGVTDRVLYATFSFVLGITALTGVLLASSRANADNDTAVDNISIEVPVSCTMTGTGQTSHEATLLPGTYSGASGSQYQNGIGTTTLTTFCNDNNGFSIYAIGYSADTDGNNTLIGENTSLTIPTKVYESTDTTSNWSMKVNKVENQSGQDPVAWNPENMTITNSFSSWHTVPDDYTKVAEYKATTGSSATDTTLGGKVTTTYASYISTTQAADTYEGQVKYVMVHPYDHAAPIVPPTPPTSCNTPVPGATYMQDINSSIISGLTKGAAYYLRDNRDEEPYCVSKLEDDNLWMLDNLRLDLTNSTILNGLTTSNTNVDSASLTSLKSGNRSAGARYASSGFATWDSSNPSNVYNQAKANADYKDTTTTSYGAGSGKIGVYYNYCAASAGNYCYDSGAGNAQYDICPKGWRIPTGGSSGEYNTLYTTGYSSDATNFRNALSTPLSGYFNYGSATYQGSNGDFWSSTYDNSLRMHYLGVNSSGVNPTYRIDRGIGYSVRCIIGS